MGKMIALFTVGRGYIPAGQSQGLPGKKAEKFTFVNKISRSVTQVPGGHVCPPYSGVCKQGVK